MNSEDLSDWLIVIPARLQSQRLPRKPLADLAGKPLIVRVYENLDAMRQLGASVVVATDHTDIQAVCKAHKIPTAMTSDKHQSGTDRCWEVAKNTNQRFILNVQGDEPFIKTEDLSKLCKVMTHSNEYVMGTLAFQQYDLSEIDSPNVVKAVLNDASEAMYFSREPIPHDRENLDRHGVCFWQHIGVYAFQRDALQQFCNLPPGILEQREKLEQLRALEHGIKIIVAHAQTLTYGIDTSEDLEAARARYQT